MAHGVSQIYKHRLANGFVIALLILSGLLAVLLYTKNLSVNSAKDPTTKSIWSPVKSFSTIYTVTRTYTSRNSIVINNLWRASSQLAGGGYNNCALSNGNVYCWGKGTNGQLGNSASSNSVTPVAVSTVILNNQRMTNIAGGRNHMCAVNSGLAACWGDNTYGQLGNNSATTSFNAPVQVGTFSGSLTPSQIAAGGQSTCAIADNLALCWGDNSRGQLGDGTTTQRRLPGALTGSPLRSVAPKATVSGDALYNKSITQIQVGGLFACAIANGAVYCWGDNTYGQVGNSSATTSFTTPQQVTNTGVLSGKTVTQIALGYDHACAIADGLVYCWGRNNYGQLGNGPNNGTGGASSGTTNQTAPVAVSTSTGLSGKVISNVLNGGYTHTCAVADGQAYCWGRNNLGQLGDSSTTDRPTPTAVNVAGVLSGKGVTQLIGGDSYTCSVANGRAYCWGDNSFGQLGINDTLPASTSIPYRVNDSYY